MNTFQLIAGLALPLFVGWSTKTPEVVVEKQIVIEKCIIYESNDALYTIPMKLPLPEARVSSGYGFRIHPILGYRKFHSGIDLAIESGTPIYSVGNGVVTDVDYNFSGYGWNITICHGLDINGKKIETKYAHLLPTKMEIGTIIKKGDMIGRVGSTGRSTGPHLHFEIRVDGNAVSPNWFLNKNRRV